MPTLLLWRLAPAGPEQRFRADRVQYVDHRMELMREESFGPIIGIQKVRDDDET